VIGSMESVSDLTVTNNGTGILIGGTVIIFRQPGDRRPETGSGERVGKGVSGGG